MGCCPTMSAVTLVPVIKNKAGKIGSMDNYRPITLASVISKVLESLLSICSVHKDGVCFRLWPECVVEYFRNTYWLQRLTREGYRHVCFVVFHASTMSVFTVKEQRLTYQKVWNSSLHCCVPKCTNSSRYNREISFIPVDHAVRAEWMSKIRREDLPYQNHPAL